jgi:hypothetical protein
LIIHPNTPRNENGSLCLSARIELETPHHKVPETLWFKIPESQAHLATDRADGFVVALLYFALARGENIHFRGTLSPRLALGIRDYQRIQTLWHGKEYKPIEIHADAYAPTPPSEGKKASAFSGGVDSFFTLWSHLPANDSYPENALSYAMFVHGLDIGLEDRAWYRKLAGLNGRMMRELDIELLTPSTNARHYDDARGWMWANQVTLIGLAHLFGRALGRFYVPCSYFYGNSPNDGAWPLLDALLSSESLEVMSDGAYYSKFERIEHMTRFPATYDRLRICNNTKNGRLNCCQCDKCVSVMTALELLGMREKYTAFPAPLTRNQIRFTPATAVLRFNHRSILLASLARGRYDLASDIAVKLGLGYLRWGTKWARRKIGAG